MKNWKKLLACLLVGLMALTVFTACDASVGAPMSPKRSDAESAKALCKQFDNMTYSKELSDKAYTIANWVVSSSVSCKVYPNKPELYRYDNVDDVAKTYLKQGSYAYAFDSMGIGKGIGGGMANNDFVPGFYIDTDLESNGTSVITFVLPKDGTYPEAMTKAAEGKTKLGVAYVVKDGVSYAVVLFG
ncbi:MAG: hypothetical protein U0N39_06035 [Faecalibacterium prausnitzii]